MGEVMLLHDSQGEQVNAVPKQAEEPGKGQRGQREQQREAAGADDVSQAAEEEAAGADDASQAAEEEAQAAGDRGAVAAVDRGEVAAVDRGGGVAPAVSVFTTMDAVLDGEWAQIPLFAAQAMEYLAADVPPGIGGSRAEYTALLGTRAMWLLQHLSLSAERAKRREQDAATGATTTTETSGSDARGQQQLFGLPTRRDALWLAAGLLTAQLEGTRLVAAAAAARLLSGAVAFDAWATVPSAACVALAAQFDDRLVLAAPVAAGWALGALVARSTFPGHRNRNRNQ